MRSRQLAALLVALAVLVATSNAQIRAQEFRIQDVSSPAEVAEMGFAALTGLDTPPAGALEQNIFYINQVMQFGKLLAVFQAHPSDAKQTIVTVFVALAVESSVLAKKKEFVKVPVLRNLVPAQVLAGKSSFNSGSSISAGLPVYARNEVKAIAAILERK